MNPPPRFPAFTPCALALILAGCASTGVTDSTDLEGPVIGKPDPTKFVAGTDGSTVGLGDIARIAKTVRKYKNLGASDQEIVRRVASLKLDGLIASQMERLRPEFERRKARVRKETQAKVASIKTRGVSKPVTAVQVEVATAELEGEKQLQQIDLDWKAAARAEVAKSYGADFAVPVANPEGRAVVAFASLRDSGISVSAASYELVGTAAQLASAADAGRPVSHQGRSYALLDTQVELR